MKKADLLDRKILKVISVDARRSFKEIAGQCGVSRAAIHQRVVRMVEKGTITGSGYQVSPKYLGFGTCTYIGIKLERGSMYNDAVEELTNIPEIVECHFTTGPYTMLVKLYSRDNEHLKDLLNSRIQQIPGVTSTETMISLEQSIARTVPITLGEEEDDEKHAGRHIEVVDEVEN
ncbi:AsnC family transcriptional regulator [Alloprevotella sp. OH1205_COT-284]|uniref:Lrp/AsnC family transcriptional regulator n=1 Tax=Alloprevotella sp. OH1205_COT-284 TaxID=2491043 RepID=UPI000F5FCBB6|nr:Lrp/AsnC ligand binding domain-containing protein [Alloprevotella sp. OH1205_COT-284]RRD80782.1 AsnC family transcriptional regulator [Alloprevotella sp. OH1205_COT-284]